MEKHLSNTSSLNVQVLPEVVRNLLELPPYTFLPNGRQIRELFVHYLHCKPGRGLIIDYRVCEILPRRQRKCAAQQTISLIVDPQHLTGSSILSMSEKVKNTPLKQHFTGIVQAPDLGLVLQSFPADANVSGLVECCDTSSGSPLLVHLQEAARLFLADDRWKLLAAQARVVCYKPTKRCILCYDLTLTHPRANKQELSVFGKIYADSVQAHVVQQVTQQLYDEQLAFQGNLVAGFTQQNPFLPRPLFLIEAWNLVLNEAIRPVTPADTLHTGPDVLKPQIAQERGGKVASLKPPAYELRLAAIALARLHTSQIALNQKMLRTGAEEAKRLRAWAALAANYYPTQAVDIRNLVQILAQRLENLQPETYRPAHGAFKSTQLLYCNKTIAVVDFDGCCLADPALDIGCFLAFLRPGGLWYRRQGRRAWFEAAAEVFTTTYSQALQELGVPLDETTHILQRSHLYTASFFFRIASRRAERLNSPRPQELAMLLKEAASCLALSI